MRHLLGKSLTVLASALLCAGTAMAEPSKDDGASATGWSRIGYGRLINNDLLGDGKDRYQSGSYVSSRMYARGGSGQMPDRLGQVLEFRLQADVKAPANVRRPVLGDRPFAGSLTFGLHSHYRSGGNDIAIGTEMAVTGPVTQLDALQTALHDTIGVPSPNDLVRSAQVPNAVHPGLVVEVARPWKLSSRTQLRPFMEGRAGVETLVRAGFDLNFGSITQEPLMVRDGITGHRYRTLVEERGGFAFTVGMDTALVSDSAYLPASRGLTLTDTRDRARIGLHWERERSYGFFGFTYLGKEFVTQAEPQILGSVRLALRF